MHRNLLIGIWSRITSLSLASASFISRIETNPAAASSIVTAVQGTTAQGRVWLSGNRASSWTDLTGNLLKPYHMVLTES